MNHEELSQAVHATLTIPDKYESMQAYEALCSTLAPAERFAARAVLDALRLHEKELSEKQVVVLLHGANTVGTWQELVRSELRNFRNIKVECLGYEWYDVVRFLLPFFGRWIAVNKITKDLRTLRSRYPGYRFTVVAHSFGTYLISQILKRNSDIELDSAILCGCVVRPDFDWATVPNKPRNDRFLNDVGTKDLWPVVAGALSVSYGPSGFMGFKGPYISDRYFPYRHSDFFEVTHIKQFWLPFILRGEILEGSADRNRQPPGLLVNILTTRWPHGLLFGGLVVWNRSFLLGLIDAVIR